MALFLVKHTLSYSRQQIKSLAIDINAWTFVSHHGNILSQSHHCTLNVAII